MFLLPLTSFVKCWKTKLRLPEKLSKYLGQGIFELKVSHTFRTSRCLYFYIKDKTIIFTHGFFKKTRKTPGNEIKRAIKLRDNFLKLNLCNMMKTNYEKYRDEKMSKPEFQVKYAFAKEKLNLELMIDSIKESLEQEKETKIIKRRLNKLARYVTQLSL